MDRAAISYTASLLLHLITGGCVWGFVALAISPPEIEVQRGRPITITASLPAAHATPDEALPPVEVEATPNLEPPPALAPQPTATQRMTAEAGELPEPPLTEQLPETALEPSALPAPRQKTEAPQQPEASRQLDRRPRELPTPVATSVAIPLQATAETGVEVDELPTKLPANRPPTYPLDALQAGIEGRVVLRTLVSAEGRVVSMQVETSAGDASLDRAALSAVRAWRFSPARRAGVAVEYEVLVPVNFRIRRS